MKKTIFILAAILLTLIQCKKEVETDLTKTIVGTYYNSSQDYYINVGKKDDRTVTLYLHGSNIWGQYFDSVTITTSTTFTLNNGDTSHWQLWNDSTQSSTGTVYATHTGNGYFNATNLTVNIFETSYNDSTNALIGIDTSSYAGLLVIR